MAAGSLTPDGAGPCHLSSHRSRRLTSLDRENRELRIERDFPKMGPSSSPEGTVSAKLASITAEKATGNHPPVIKMGRWLQVSTSGSYDHVNLEESDRDRRRAKVADEVQAAFDLGRGT